jgi:hypothetical protein
MFKKMKTLAGKPDVEVLQHGELGRGIVTALERTGVFAGATDADAHQVCIFTLDIRLDNQPPFEAEVRQQIATPDLAQIVPGSSIVAVRVDSVDHSRVVIDLSTPPPVVTIPSSSAASAASILAAGHSVRAVIQGSGPLYAKNVEGVEIYSLKITVLAEGRAPAEFNVGNPVPPAALPLLYPGCNLPAKQMPEPPDDIAIDWDAALAEYSSKPT